MITSQEYVLDENYLYLNIFRSMIVCTDNLKEINVVSLEIVLWGLF